MHSTKVYKASVVVLIAVCWLTLNGRTAHAASISFDLDCYIVSPGSCTDLFFSYGTVTLSDDTTLSNEVLLTVDLEGNSVFKRDFGNATPLVTDSRVTFADLDQWPAGPTLASDWTKSE